MLGIYIAYSIATKVGGGLGFWGSLLLAPVLVAAIGALIEIALLRRIYQAPELFQLLATFAVLLVINDATLWIWGNEDLFGPRAPGLRGSVEILNRRFPSYDLFLIAIGPCGPYRHVCAACENALRPADPCRDAGPRDGRCARRQPGAAVHRGVRLRLGAGRPWRRAAARTGAGKPRDGSGRARRRLRGRGGRRHGLDHRRLSRSRHHRRDQGALHRHRRREHLWPVAQLLQAHAGRGVFGDGRGADRAALWPARAAADRGAQHRSRRGAAARAARSRSDSPRSRSWCF